MGKCKPDFRKLKLQLSSHANTKILARMLRSFKGLNASEKIPSTSFLLIILKFSHWQLIFACTDFKQENFNKYKEKVPSVSGILPEGSDFQGRQVT